MVDYTGWIVRIRSFAWRGVNMVLAGSLAVWIISMIKQRLTIEVNPQVEKSFRNFLETIVMHVIGILATFVMFTSCDMKIGLRNDHIVMPALKREGDDPRNQPTYADPSVYDLNRPWIIERKERLPIDVDTFTKVWVMGSYKVGKTSLLKWLGVHCARPSNLVNTRGEIFYTAPSWDRTLFVDTEGFDQPINVTEPEFRKRLVVTHAHKAADAIILVVPMLTQSDMSLFNRNIKAMRPRRTSIFVVHNIQFITTQHELNQYATMISKIYQRPEERDLPVAPQTPFRITHHGPERQIVAVTHFFLGSMSYLQDWNMMCVRELASRLRHVQTQAFPLIRTLQESLCLVASSTYAFGNTENGNVTCEVAEECNESGEIYKFRLSQEITESMARVIGDNTILGYTLDYKWLPPRMDGRYYRQRLLIGLSRVQIVEILIPDETTLTVRFLYRNAYNDADGGIKYDVASGSEV